MLLAPTEHFFSRVPRKLVMRVTSLQIHIFFMKWLWLYKQNIKPIQIAQPYSPRFTGAVLSTALGAPLSSQPPRAKTGSSAGAHLKADALESDRQLEQHLLGK